MTMPIHTTNCINLKRPTTFPYAWSFGYVNNADQSSVTGDGSVYQVTFADAIWDNIGFDGSTLTVSQEGNYVLGVSLYFSGITTAMTDSYIYIVADGVTYRLTKEDFSPGQSASGICAYSNTILAPMTAASTATVHVCFANGAKVVSIPGATSTGYRTPYFYGYLLSEV